MTLIKKIRNLFAVAVLLTPTSGCKGLIRAAEIDGNVANCIVAHQDDPETQIIVECGIKEAVIPIFQELLRTTRHQTALHRTASLCVHGDAGVDAAGK